MKKNHFQTDYKEWDSMEYIYLEPNTQRFLTLQSRYFYTSEELQISFQVISLTKLLTEVSSNY
jgi:hypothetical protein